ncbi:RecQ family ATP-dependent DNA helicase [Anthocerotibacter panamensis]|uniref:RecQ family ATP-dependent DNA helicase n=1 Tax=Anthocerotibacter panamensis TaxID=2857077 RepID=UPI001C4057FD|nr:RecQ family ATP-dependent DNA helicase [Anthocerotibacter panamensis]
MNTGVGFSRLKPEIPEDEDEDFSYDLTGVLAQVWGYSQFRAPQRELVTALTSGQDTLALLPTGAGKSLCFQLPALLHLGTTLVITPLVALMEDQVQALRLRRVAAACYHSELPTPERLNVLQGMEEGRWSVLYVSPEGLLSREVWLRLGYLDLARMVLDEAHCLATWGSSFRPTYRRLGAVRKALRLPIAAFTATASPVTRACIQTVLGLHKPHIIALSPYRPNLQLTVRPVFTPAARRRALLQFLQKHQGQPGLVYVRSRSGAEDLAAWLTREGFLTSYYHAGLLGRERRTLERRWLEQELPFLLCTSAFGMGVNHASLRWVVHYEPPVCTEEYLQEIGRAGRDGQPAEGLLLASEPTGLLDDTDKRLHQYFARHQERQQHAVMAHIQKLPPSGVVTELTDSSAELAQVLGLLHQAGHLDWVTPFHYRCTHVSPQIAPPQPQTTLHMQRYPHTRQCRWQFLLSSLGETLPKSCGHCDNCRGQRNFQL